MHACNYEPVPQSDSVGVMDPRTNTSKPAGGIFSAARDDSRRGGDLFQLWSWGCWRAEMEVQAGKPDDDSELEQNTGIGHINHQSSTCLKTSVARRPQSTSVIFTVSERRLPEGC